MSLKDELQAISPSTLRDVANAYNEKMGALHDNEDPEFEAEVGSAVASYPALMEFTMDATRVFLKQGAKEHGITEAAVAKQHPETLTGFVMGVVFTLGVLTEVAEIQELPQ